MNEEKGFTGEGRESSTAETAEEKKKLSSSSRARNRTVMLTPEMTGQVRALLHQETDEETGEQPEITNDPLEQFLPPVSDWQTPSAEPSASEPTFEDIGASAFESSPPVEEPEPVFEPQEGDSWESPSFDPLSSLAPPPEEPSQPLAETSNPFEDFSVGDSADNRPAQPSFSVNRAVTPKAPAAVAPRAPRSPVEANTRISPASSSGERTKVIGFLVSFDKDACGDVVEIRTGRWLLTSRPTDHGDYILIPDETISPLHAIIRATSEGEIQVLDQLSEFGTAVCRVGSDQETENTGGLETVSHGDTVRFGKRHFVVCMVPKVSSITAEDSSDN